jgi:thermitase
MRKTLVSLTSFALAAGFASAQQLSHPRPEMIRPGVLAAADRLIVQHRLGADRNALARTLSVHGAVVDHSIEPLHLSVIKVDPARREEIQKRLEESGLFNFVEPDYYAQVTATPNDPGYGQEWHLAAIQAPGAWNYTVGSPTVKVAMVDSGVDGTHPDLAPNLAPGYNFVSGGANTSDTMGHGTTTAGVVAAAGNNGVGVTGVEWTSSIMPLVVVDSTGYASYSNIAEAISYAANNGARIVNVSIGGTAASSTLQSAVNYAWSLGTVVFASAGNGGANAPYYPAGCQYVVAVGATDQNNNWESWSNYGSFLSLVAPGSNIYTTSEGGGYTYGSGTSYSSPIAAGVAALVLSYSPSLSASALVSRLEQTATDFGAAGYDPYYGWGLVNASQAITGLSYTPPAPPTVTIAAPSNGSTVQGMVSVTGSASASAGLSSVQFYVDGTLASTSTSSPYSFSWNTSSASNATHTLMVKAIDKLNNAGQATVSAVVNNPAPATASNLKVSITSPANGAKEGVSMMIAAAATDTVPVTQVSIYVDGVQDYSGSVAPYAFVLNSRKLSPGAHTITAKAWDSNGVTATSAPVSFIALK